MKKNKSSAREQTNDSGKFPEVNTGQASFETALTITRNAFSILQAHARVFLALRGELPWEKRPDCHMTAKEIADVLAEKGPRVSAEEVSASLRRLLLPHFEDRSGDYFDLRYARAWALRHDRQIHLQRAADLQAQHDVLMNEADADLRFEID